MSGGFFYKDLKDCIYVYTYDQPINGTIFHYTQPLNGDAATIRGLEVALQNQLTFLPSPLNGLGVHANYIAGVRERELALFGTTGYQQDREGLGIYDLGNGTGYIVSVDQLPGESVFHIYRREGEPGRPHDHAAVLMSFTGGADGTGGLEVTSAPLGHDFPDGVLVAMNSAARNFLLFRWGDIAVAAREPLKVR